MHHQVLAQGLDDPQWLTRTPEDRCARLADALSRDMGPRAELDPLGKRTLGVFEALVQGRHRYGAERDRQFHRQRHAVARTTCSRRLLLARWAEAYDKRTGEIALDVAPLFESVDTLDRCGDVMRTLLAEPVYRRHLEARGRRQCVLIGYSDSNEEDGPCASRFATHQAQRSLAGVLAADGESFVIFHARGGSIARGGGRVDAMVRAAPAEALNGMLRFTEQGESIQQSYGLRPIAMRTLERAFNALRHHDARRRVRASSSPIVDGSSRDRRPRSRRRAARPIASSCTRNREFYDYLPRRHADRRDRAHADRLAPGASIRARLASIRCVPCRGCSRGRRRGTCCRAGMAPVPALPPLARSSASTACARRTRTGSSCVISSTTWKPCSAAPIMEIASAYNVLAPEPLHRFFVTDPRWNTAWRAHQVLTLKGCAELLDSDGTLQRGHSAAQSLRRSR